MQDPNLLDRDIKLFYKDQKKRRERNKRQKRQSNRRYHRLYRDFFVQVAYELDVKLPAYQKISVKTSNETNNRIKYLIKMANSHVGSNSEDASSKINELQTKLNELSKIVTELKQQNSDLKQTLQNYKN